MLCTLFSQLRRYISTITILFDWNRSRGPKKIFSFLRLYNFNVISSQHILFIYKYNIYNIYARVCVCLLTQTRKESGENKYIIWTINPIAAISFWKKNLMNRKSENLDFNSLDWPYVLYICILYNKHIRNNFTF